VCLSVIEIQTIGPISMKFGTLEIMTGEWFLHMFEKNQALGWPSKARKLLLAKLCTLQKIF
jgi:hypothetical protein